MKIFMVILGMAFSSLALAEEMESLDCNLLANNGAKYRFLEIDWYPKTGTGDASYYTNKGDSMGDYAGFEVSSSANTLDFQTPIKMMKDQPNQYIKNRINRITMRYSAEIVMPNWVEGKGAPSLSIDGRCYKADRKSESES